jgi:hypothetical protein
MQPCQTCGSTCLGRFLWEPLPSQGRLVLCLDCFAIELRRDEEAAREREQVRSVA